jgi:hypothetical protein
MRFALCLIAITVAGCGSSGSSSPVAAAPSRCSTGTEVVLARPVPGTTVSHHVTSLKIASSSVIAYENTALLAESKAGMATGPFALVGPVPKPKKRVKLPFKAPVYYAAHGFQFIAGQTYVVEVVRTSSDCRPDVIRNAQFNVAK